MGRISHALKAARDGSRQSIDALAAVLLEYDTDDAVSALALDPRALLLLDGRARRWSWPGPPEWLAAARDRFVRGTAGPVAIALTSLHRDGRLREATLASLPAAALPFLALRCADWVAPVRDRARASLIARLYDHPASALPIVAPLALLLERRSRGRFVRTQLDAALLAAPAPLLRRLARDPSALQLSALAAAAARRELRAGALAAIAATSADPVVARAAAEHAAREAVWTGRHEVLTTLVRARTAGVRALGLTGFVRAGEAARAAEHLADANPLVRAVARDAARRGGTDAAAWYRRAIAAGPLDPALLIGLAECGAETDAPLLAPALAHPEPRVRAAGVRALRLLGAAPSQQLPGLLGDPSAAVVRQVATALRPHAARVDAELLWTLLGSAERAQRRAAYVLLAGHPGWTPLRAALVLGADRDPRLARRGRADASRLERQGRLPAGDPPDDLLELAAIAHARRTGAT